MKPENLGEFSIEQLVALFQDLAIAQDRAEFEDRIELYNKLYERMQLVLAELKGRGGDGRRALAKLRAHSNAQVRLMSAIHTLALAPDESRAVLKELAESRIYPQAANAGFMLEGLASGQYKPS